MLPILPRLDGLVDELLSGVSLARALALPASDCALPEPQARGLPSSLALQAAVEALIADSFGAISLKVMRTALVQRFGLPAGGLDASAAEIKALAVAFIRTRAAQPLGHLEHLGNVD